ncbi:MAG: hypothetical protein C0596_15915 [Marinilabiliales bacterium]|nr:MAG: hypothetical protein C0596_15915 [Marinilabiliales bacterium]
MQNRFVIYPEVNFGVSKLSPGITSINDLLAIAKEFRLDKNFNKVHYQLTDLRECIFDFKSDEINKMISLVNEYKDKDNQKIGVYLVDKPMETALVALFFKNLDAKREFCYTIEGAYKILNMPISFDKFKTLIDI